MTISGVEPFFVDWREAGPGGGTSAFVKITTRDGLHGLGEASPMGGGITALTIIANHMAPMLLGRDPLDHSVLIDTLLHRCIKLGPEGAVTSALAALDIALWDLKGKMLGQPVHKLLGGAWRTRLPLYTSIGNAGQRSPADLVGAVEARVAVEKPALVKIRLDGDRTQMDYDIPGDIARARAVRVALGPDMPLAFDANNAYSVSGAIRVGRALEELGYTWFEEPVQHYHLSAMGEVARRLDITVSAGEQTYTLQGLVHLMEVGVRMVQPDIVKMGGVTGMKDCAALCHAHGVELVPHQTQPSVGHAANLQVLASLMHMTRPVELADGWTRTRPVFPDLPGPAEGHFILPSGPGLGVLCKEDELSSRRRSCHRATS